MKKCPQVRIKTFKKERHHKRVKRQARDLGKIFAINLTNKELLSRIYKEQVHISKKQADNLIGKQAKALNSHFRKYEKVFDLQPLTYKC